MRANLSHDFGQNFLEEHIFWLGVPVVNFDMESITQGVTHN